MFGGAQVAADIHPAIDLYLAFGESQGFLQGIVGCRSIDTYQGGAIPIGGGERRRGERGGEGAHDRIFFLLLFRLADFVVPLLEDRYSPGPGA